MLIQFFKITGLWLFTLLPLLVLGFLVFYKLGLWLVLLIGVALLVLMLKMSSEYVLYVSGAKIAVGKQYLEVEKAISRLSFLLNIPTPNLYILKGNAGPLAFCARSFVGNGKIILREDFISQLTEDELQAVLANLLSKISMNDSSPLTSLVAVKMFYSKVMSYMQNLIQKLFGNSQKISISVRAVMEIMLVPFSAFLTNLILSKKYYTQSDVQSVHLVFDFRALESALMKADSMNVFEDKALDYLCFVAPERLSLFSFSTSIPSVSERLDVLKQV